MRRFAAALLLLASIASADETDFAGRWTLHVQIPAEPLVGLLELEQSDGGWIAWVEGGPAPVTIDGNTIELFVDARDRQGFRFQRKLDGTLEDGRMSGTLTSIDVVESAAEFGEDGAAWSAAPYADSAPEVAIRSAADIAGIWAPLRGLDFRKWTMALTPAAKAWHANYDARMDEPQKRCISPGLYSAISWSFPFEIVADDDKLLMLYEAFNLTRRVFTDGRDDPDFFLPELGARLFDRADRGRRTRHRHEVSLADDPRFQRRTDLRECDDDRALSIESWRRSVDGGLHAARPGQLRA